MKKVFLSLGAEKDLENIYDYIKLDSKTYADNIINNFLICFENLSLFPEIGSEYKKDENYINVRQIFQGNYRIIYEIFKDKIEIITIVHNARNIKNEN